MLQKILKMKNKEFKFIIRKMTLMSILEKMIFIYRKKGNISQKDKYYAMIWLRNKCLQDYRNLGPQIFYLLFEDPQELTTIMDSPDI